MCVGVRICQLKSNKNTHCVLPGLCSSNRSGGQMKMKEIVVYGISILLFDIILSLAYVTGLVLLHFSGSGGLRVLWAFAVVKWAFLQGFTWIFADVKCQAVLSRMVVLLCLLSPVCDSLQIFMAPLSEPYREPPADLGRLLLGTACSLFACVVWEMGFWSDTKVQTKSNDLSSRRLLMRVVKYFKPDALYVFAAFTFLILAVICKY